MSQTLRTLKMLCKVLHFKHVKLCVSDKTINHTFSLQKILHCYRLFVISLIENNEYPVNRGLYIILSLSAQLHNR